MKKLFNTWQNYKSLVSLICAILILSIALSFNLFTSNENGCAFFICLLLAIFQSIPYCIKTN